LIPYPSIFILEPIIDVPFGQLQNEFPKPELLWTQPGSAAAQEPGFQFTIRKSRPEPFHRFPVTLIEQPSNDQIPIPVPPELMKRMIPEEWLDAAGERLSAGPRFFGHPFILAHFGLDPSTSERSRCRGLKICKNIIKIRPLAQRISRAIYAAGQAAFALDTPQSTL
jgi:hypothetical protein